MAEHEDHTDADAVGNRQTETRRKFRLRNAVDVTDLDAEPALRNRVAWTQSQTMCKPWPQSPDDGANAYTKGLREEFDRLQRRLVRLPEMAIMRVTDIHVIGYDGTLYDAGSRSILFGRAIGLASDVLRKRRQRLTIRFRAPQRVIAQDPGCTYVLVDQPGIMVYGHFLLDILPKIYVAEKLLQRPVKFVLRYYLPWMRDMLATLGYGEEQIVVAAEDAVLHFDELHVPHMIKNGYAVNVGLLKEAWSHLIDRIAALRTAAPAPRGRRLFLSRRKLQSRPRVANEDELFEIARGFGFERISPETLSFSEQVELFSGAELIAGEDGSALHSAIFCTHGRAMIAFMRPDRENLWHLAFAHAAGMDFHAIKCQSQADGYVADAAEFEKLLNVVVTGQHLKSSPTAPTRTAEKRARARERKSRRRKRSTGMPSRLQP